MFDFSKWKEEEVEYQRGRHKRISPLLNLMNKNNIWFIIIFGIVYIILCVVAFILGTMVSIYLL